MLRADAIGMELANDMVEFSPDPAQLARVGVAGPGAAPPVWLALGGIAVALGVSLSVALPPATKAVRGSGFSVSAVANRSDLLRTADLGGAGDR